MLCIRRKVRMPERQVNNMNRIENLVDLDKLNELKVSELKKLNKLLGKEVEEKKERNVLLQQWLMLYTVSSLHRIIWKTSRMISKTKQMTWKRMTTTSSRMKERTNP